MSAMTVNGSFHNLDISSQSPPKPSSPSSPTFATHSSANPRSFISLTPSSRSQPPTFSSSNNVNGPLDPPPGVLYSEFIRTWTDTHVARWLSDIKCGSHAATFKANDIRGDILLELDQDTLKEMGLASIGDRLRIINAVKALRQRASSRTPSVPSLDTSQVGKLTVEDPPRPADRNESSSLTRLGNRNRPSPLQLNPQTTRADLPHIVRDAPPDSAKTLAPTIRPLPQQPTMAGTPNTSRSGQLPPLPPPPRTQPPPPPPSSNRGINRNVLGNASSIASRRTPTQSEAPAYTSSALPPPPVNQTHLTPSSATGNWNQTPDRPGSRNNSPLIPARRLNLTAPATHIRHGSGGPQTATPSLVKGPQRPPTTNSHPYSNPTSALLPPLTAQQHNLSPIAESFKPEHPASGTPSPPSGYAVGRGPFVPITPSHSAAPSLDDLRRKLVKFLLPDEGLSSTIDVATCAGGVEVMEKVLKKFGKGGSRSADAGGLDHIQSDEGGLSVDGWGVYLDMGQNDGPATPLTEAELLSICHDRNHPTRDHGLTLRKTARARRYDERSGASSPSQNKTAKNTKRASSISILSGLGVRDPEKALEPPSPTESTTGNSSPTDRSSPNPRSRRPSKLRNFFGQRPPSELIKYHLQEYFPNTEKKVLERTARHSMMRTKTLPSIRWDSLPPSENLPPTEPPLPSRFSSSTQGSFSLRSVSPNRSSYAPPVTPLPPLPDIVVPDGQSNAPDAGDNLPVPSATTTETSRPVENRETSHQLLPPIPFPSQSLSESLEALTGEGQQQQQLYHPHHPHSRSASISSRRMSYMTELRSKRDRSDTASLMTVDEITANVESRRVSMAVDRGSDTDDWTKVETEDGMDSASVHSLLNGDDEPSEEEEEEEDEEDPEDEEEETLQDDDEEEEGGGGRKVNSKGATKWIKGALIGAGSFGKVYLGMDASNGLLMAVKQVELPTGSAPNQARKKSMLSALEREIELLKNLQHENIVQYLYSSLDDDYLNIFLEYVPGGSVTALLRNYGAFEEPLVKNFVRQILEGLNYLHERDIIHRDIKGANILVDNKGGIKISDFGISKKVDDNMLTGNRNHRPSFQGSVFWMAPEVIKQSAHTRKADIWSVGCLVVEMLTGEHPYAQLSQMQAIFQIGSMGSKPTIPSDISAEAQEFLKLTFELNHEARPSASALLQHPWICPPKKSNQANKGNNAALRANVPVEVAA